jgi:anaerobic selenocysteine-containing dehydrogenase
MMDTNASIDKIVINEQSFVQKSQGFQLSRRDFLGITATVAAIAGVSTLAARIPFQMEKVEAQTQTTATTSEQVIPSVCRMCQTYDGILVHVSNGQPAYIEGNPLDPQSLGRMCAKGQSGIWQHYDPYRAKAPLKRTNPNKGTTETGNWVEISWDEALNTVANAIKTAQAKGPEGYVVYNSGSAMSYSQTFNAFATAAVGTNYKVDFGMNWCGHIGHYLSRQAHGAFTSAADYARCKYLIQTGRTQGMEAGGYFLTYGVLLAEGRARGMKIVNLSPFLSTAATQANEWIPVMPATEGAVGSAMLEVLLVELKQYDVAFVKVSTNGPYLIGPDGLYVRDATTKKPLVWDPVDNKAKTYDDATIKDVALLGTFTVSGLSQNNYNKTSSTLTNVTANPAFQLLVNAVTPMTPEWAESISGASSATIRRIATEFLAAAQIGATTNINGKTYPLRPASIEYYGGNASNHVHGTANGMAWEMINTVIGAQDVPGGHTNSVPPWVLPGPDGMILPPAAAYSISKSYKFQNPPVTPELQEYFPLGDHFGAVAYLAMNNPTEFGGAGNHKLDLIMFQAWNPMLSMFDPPKMQTIYQSAGFVAAICLQIEESAEGYADIVLPDCCYLEEYQLIGGLMQPVTSAPPGVLNNIELLSEIASRGGFLQQYNVQLSSSLKAPFTFDTTQKTTSSAYFDLLLKSTYGSNYGLAYFQQQGNNLHGKTPITWLWQPWKYNFTPPRRLPIYFENQVQAMTALKANMEANNVAWSYEDYSPVPTWLPSHITTPNSTPPYDLIAFAYHVAFHTYTWTNENPLLAEISMQNPYVPAVTIYSGDAQARGIAEGDLIWVESAVGKEEGIAHLSEGVYPGSIAIQRTMGGWARNSVVKDLYKEHKGVSYQLLREVNLDYIDKQTDALENCIKVKVTKAT